MRFNRLVLFNFIVLALFLLCGCQKQVETVKNPQPPMKSGAKPLLEQEMALAGAKPSADQKEKPGQIGQVFMQKKSKKETEKSSQVAASHIWPVPHIRFDKAVLDYGEISPGIKYVSQFKFTNTGDAVLKITSVRGCCGLVLKELTKTEYAPGESGVLEGEFLAVAKAGPLIRQIGVSTNDPLQSEIELTLRGNIVPKVSYEPASLQLRLKEDNAGCPEIKLTSLDGKPFAITQFMSAYNCITADIDPTKQATEFVLKPKVDMNALEKAMYGIVQISLTHPGCGEVVIPFNGLPEFKITPPQIYIVEAEPLKPIVRKLWILSNYDENIEIDSILSLKKIIKVLDQRKTGDGYQFELEITPPEPDAQKKFSDTFVVKLKGGKKLTVPCQGYYN